ncbi:MAG: hypothetical protein KUG80_01420 [Gammaproteobacteria bacterium]|nr:hypothetical protein [Gammaproteobacteria bacterium]
MDRNSYDSLNHEGLLSERSADDLRNTYIYVARVTDGKFIVERIGRKPSE